MARAWTVKLPMPPGLRIASAGAAVVIEGDETLHRPRQVGDDKADARIKLTRMALDPRLREGRLLATTRRGFVHEPAW